MTDGKICFNGIIALLPPCYLEHCSNQYLCSLHMPVHLVTDSILIWSKLHLPKEALPFFCTDLLQIILKLHKISQMSRALSILSKIIMANVE